MSHADIDPAGTEPAALEEESGVVAVDVVGSLARARFPALCIRCGAGADHTIPVTKLFWRENGNRPSYLFTAGVDAPACAGCAATHQREVRPIAPEVKRRLLRSWLVAALPYLFPLGVILWLLTVLGPNLLQALAEGEPVEMAVWAGVCGFFALLGLMFFRLVMRAGRPMILAGTHTPHLVHAERGPLGGTFVVPAEPTSVQSAIDFSDDESELFEPERHRFTFRNREVAAGFAELNAHRDWDPASTRAQLAKRLRWALYGAIGLGLLYALLADYFL